MKVSKYNHFIPFTTSKSIAYNALSNALALIDNENLQAYTQFAENGIEIKNDKLIKSLLHGSFLLGDNINELDIIRHKIFSGRYATNVLTLTIAPTSDCNFRCTYCYEKKVINCTYMTEEIQEAIVNLLESQKSNLQAVSVVWYGGEPLLALGIIQNLSVRFKKICEDEKIKYSSYMITNGYLLTQQTLETLKSLDVSFLQVTLDGDSEHHNQRRPLMGGGETFETILKNLKDGYDLLPKVSLRVNIDYDNISVAHKINNYLHEYGLSDKVIPYFGCVRSDNDCYSEDKCLNACDFAEIEYNFAIGTSQPKNYYPINKASFCCADRICGYVIAADGLLYKCWSDIGNVEKSVGNILETSNSVNEVYLKYMLFDPTQVSPCKECNILPICMGGCPFQRIAHEQQCSNYKYILERCLTDITNKLQEKKL